MSSRAATNPHGVRGTGRQWSKSTVTSWFCRCGDPFDDRAGLDRHIAASTVPCGECGIELWNHSHYVAGDHPHRSGS